MGRAVPLALRTASTRTHLFADCLECRTPHCSVCEAHAEKTRRCLCSGGLAGRDTPEHPTRGSFERHQSHEARDSAQALRRDSRKLVFDLRRLVMKCSDFWTNEIGKVFVP